MRLERKLSVQNRYTDLFKDTLGKDYRVKTDHKTMLIVQELFKKGKNAQEEDDEKAMELLLGKEAWAEIKGFLESSENYLQNSLVAKIEIYSIAFGQDFEEMASRFQNVKK